MFAIAEDILDIGDDGRNDWMEILDRKGEPTGGWKVNGEAVQRSKLRSDDRKWLLSKLVPKVFGDAVTLKGDKENPLFATLAAALDERIAKLQGGPVLDAVAVPVITSGMEKAMHDSQFAPGSAVRDDED